MLEGYQKAFGPKHPDMLIVNNLAAVLYEQGNQEAAKVTNRRALGPEHTYTLASISYSFTCAFSFFHHFTFILKEMSPFRNASSSMSFVSRTPMVQIHF